MIVTISAGDAGATGAALAFYDAALGALGWVRAQELVDEEEDPGEARLEAAAWVRPGDPASVWVVTGRTVTTGLHLRLEARSPVEVETFFSAAVSAGGTGVGAPQLAPSTWAPDGRTEYAASVRDPAGNVLEAVSAS